MTMTLKTLMFAGVASIAASGAIAQQAEVPPFLQQMDGLSYQGQVSGMDLYAMDGFDGMWLVAPDGRTAIAGTVFSAQGRDIGSAFLGREPVRAFEMGQVEAPVTAEGVTPVNPNITLPQNPTEQSSLLTGEELDAMEAGVSRIGDDIFGDAGNEAEAPVAEPQDADTAVSAANVTRDAQEALEGLSPADKDLLMKALVEMLADVKSEAEFKSVVEVWTNEVVRRHRDGTEVLEPASGVVDDSQAPAMEDHASAMETGPEAEQPVVLEETERTLADELLDEVRHDALWFGIGNHEAPAVYAFIDPACPYCARAIVNIGDAISDGELQLRVVLAPVVSQNSPGLIASILTHEEPPIAFMEHEYAWAEGRRFLQPAEWTDIPGQVRDGLLYNVELMKKYEIRGVPFFVFDTEEGARVINGVPNISALSTAIEDPFMGTN